MTTVCKTLNLNRMSKKAARIAIAKDVLARLRYRNIETRTYMNGLENISSWNSLNDDVNAQNHIKELEKNCQVCALGSMFLSHIRVFDKIMMSELTDDRDNLTSVLSDYFDQKQLDLIECAFEGELVVDENYYEETDSDVWPPIYPTEVEEAKKYIIKYRDDKKRLRAIMINVIRNNGVFKP